MTDISINRSVRDEFQALLDKSYASYDADLEGFIAAAADEIEYAINHGGFEVQNIVREYTQLAAKLADDYYQRTRNLWAEYGNVTLPSLGDYKLIDTEQALWNVQHQLINEKYIGLRYRDALSGNTKYGITLADLWPDLSNVDDAQQFIADMMRVGARLQTERNIRLDPTQPRWARVPQGKTCAFCTMLASRGFAYTSEEAAGGLGNYYHNDCDCKLVPSWGEQTLEGYNLQEYRDLYYNAKAAADSDNYRDVLKTMRRQSPGRVSDGVQQTNNISLSSLLTLKPKTSLRDVTHAEVNPLFDDWLRRHPQAAYNPRAYNPGGNNCQRTCQVMELRLRGYDVIAVGNTRATADGYRWTSSGMWLDSDGEPRKFSYAVSNKGTLALMLQYPVGSRFYVRGTWKKSDTGHIWNAAIEEVNGEKIVQMYDSQTTDKVTLPDGSTITKKFLKPSQYVDNLLEGTMEFLRVDDLYPTDGILTGVFPESTGLSSALAKPIAVPTEDADKWNEYKLNKLQWDHNVTESVNTYVQWKEGKP